MIVTPLINVDIIREGLNPRELLYIALSPKPRLTSSIELSEVLTLMSKTLHEHNYLLRRFH